MTADDRGLPPSSDTVPRRTTYASAISGASSSRTRSFTVGPSTRSVNGSSVGAAAQPHQRQQRRGRRRFQHCRGRRRLQQRRGRRRLQQRRGRRRLQHCRGRRRLQHCRGRRRLQQRRRLRQLRRLRPQPRPPRRPTRPRLAAKSSSGVPMRAGSSVRRRRLGRRAAICTRPSASLISLIASLISLIASLISLIASLIREHAFNEVIASDCLPHQSDCLPHQSDCLPHSRARLQRGACV